MNLLVTLIRKTPLVIVTILAVSAIVVGSHAGLDALITGHSDSCIPIDASTKLCLVPIDAQ